MQKKKKKKNHLASASVNHDLRSFQNFLFRLCCIRIVLRKSKITQNQAQIVSLKSLFNLNVEGLKQVK